MRPRKYLSWHQLNLIESSPARYVEYYIYDKKIPVTRAIAYGRAMADGLENGEASGDPVLDMMMAKLPKFECMDEKFFGVMRAHRKAKPFEILIKPDTARCDLSAFKEYKTGKKWTQRMADENDQITYYAMGAYLITGKIPQDIELVWVPTEEDENGKIEATGEDPVRFPTRRNWQQILNMMVRAKAGWAQIEKVCNEALV